MTARPIVADRITALVTGASAGIGAVYADRLAARGHDLILVARRRDRLESVASALRADHGCMVDTVTADLVDERDLGQVEEVVRNAPSLQVVVNCAGAARLGSAASADPAAVESMLRLNVLALTRLSLAAARRFSIDGRGTIINIGSVIAITPRAEAADYSGSKAYVLNLSRSIEAEFAGRGIVVQTVMPGPVRTEIFGEGPIPFPDELIMTPEAAVDAALAGLDLGESVTFPTLEDIEAWRDFERAREALFKALRVGNQPASRYLDEMAKPHTSGSHP